MPKNRTHYRHKASTRAVISNRIGGRSSTVSTHQLSNKDLVEKMSSMATRPKDKGKLIKEANRRNVVI